MDDIIRRQIIKSIIRANTGAPENLIEFVDKLPEEFCDCSEPSDYNGYRYMGSGSQLVVLNKFMAVSESTAYFKDKAFGRYFYTDKIYVLNSSNIEDISLYVSNKYNKRDVYKKYGK